MINLHSSILTVEVAAMVDVVEDVEVVLVEAMVMVGSRNVDRDELYTLLGKIWCHGEVRNTSCCKLKYRRKI